MTGRESADPAAHVVVTTTEDRAPAIAARLAFVDAAADEVLRRGIRRNTKAAFDQDWDHWIRYCAKTGFPVDTVSDSLLVGFVTWLARPTDDAEHIPQSPATIRRRLTGVLSNWKSRRLDVPYGVTSRARTALDNLERELAEANEQRGPGPAPAVTIKQLRSICDRMPVSLAGTRDRALILIGFGIASRRSELANLIIEDVTPEQDGLVVRVRSGKSPRSVAVKPGTYPGTCPVRAWNTWITRSDLRTGPAFRRINRYDQLLAAGLSPAAVGDIVTRRGEEAGILGLTGHSLRSGLATEARRAGHDRKTIAAQTGHSAKSAILDGYMQIVDRWADNALTGIGL